MSHWTSIKTRISNEEALRSALKDMGFIPLEGINHTVTQYGKTEEVQIKLDEAVGFTRQEDGTFAMVGDFYHSDIAELKSYYGRNAQFGLDVDARYSVHESKLLLENQQFYCIQNEEGIVDADGMIEMTFERLG